MTDRVRLVVGVVAIVVGLVWTGQGLGFVGGSFMSGKPLWATVGPVVAIVGVLLVLRARR